MRFLNPVNGEWGGQRDSNPQQQAPQAWTLPLSYGHRPGVKLVFYKGSVKATSLRLESLFNGKRIPVQSIENF